MRYPTAPVIRMWTIAGLAAAAVVAGAALVSAQARQSTPAAEVPAPKTQVAAAEIVAPPPAPPAPPAAPCARTVRVVGSGYGEPVASPCAAPRVGTR